MVVTRAKFFDQGSGQFDGPLIAPANFAHIDRGFGMRFMRLRVDLCEPLADLRRGCALVHHAHQQGELLRAMRGSALGHVRALVPPQHASA